MRRALFALAAVIAPMALTPEARGQGWIDLAFPNRAHNFGTVARGSKVHHSFKVVNTLPQEIHILTYRPKCGCTDVKLGATTIPSNTQTVIEAVVDTTKFVGNKESGLTLVVDRPAYVEIDFRLSCFIRGDLTLTPGEVQFGVVNRSGGKTEELTMTYVGQQPDWAVTRMQTLSPHVTARLTEQPRSAGSPVTYALSVTLNPSAPVGILKDEITLLTNDPTSPTIPVSVSAMVQSNVNVTPSVVTLGQVRAGETLEKTILVRSNQSFRITGTKADRPELTFATPADKPSPFHQLKATFKAPSQPGPFHAVIEVETDVKGEPPAKVNAFATVVP
jgi:hypothetical protein